jgi:predicted extracellular nuclease
MRLFHSARSLSAPALKPVVAAAVLALSSLAQASTSGVVISQVYGGGGNTGSVWKNDFIELFNAGSAPVSLSGWSVQYASATGNSWNTTALGNITLQAGQYYLVQAAAGTGGTTALPTPDATGSLALSGTVGKVALVSSTTALAPTATATSTNVVDFVGFGTTASLFEGTAPTPAPSNTAAVLRAAGGCTDSNQNASDFATGTPTPRNTSSPLNVCGGAPSNQAIVPSCPAQSVLAGVGGNAAVTATDVDSIVNNLVFSGTVPNGITLSNFSAASANGGVASGTVSVSASLAAGAYPVVLQWSNDQGQTASCTVNLTVTGAAALTPIAQIQGNGHTSPLLNQTVSTQGVVTRVNNNGFFMQSQLEDGNPATSDGVFVFTSTVPTVAVGQLAQVTGRVVEFNTGAATNAQTLSHTVTEIGFSTTNVAPTVTVVGSGYSVLPTVLSFPASDAQLEAVEGMLVQINQQLTASQNYFLGRYGQVTLGVGGRLIKPTNVSPAGSADAISLAAANAQRQILLDDGSSLQNVNPTPYIGADNTLRAGDTIDSLTGVIDYGLSTASNTGLASYKIHPTQAVTFARTNPRTSAPTLAGNSNIQVGSFNVLNFFTTFTNGATASGQSGQGCSLGGAVAAANCRGADNLFEFNRQRDKIVRAISALNADVVGLMEIQNNGNTALQNLVDGLNAFAGAGTYAAVPVPTPITGTGAGTGTDAIRVAMIYKPAKLSLVGGSVSDIDAINNRPPLAQTFAAANGEKFTVVVNHFKSKGSCPGASDADAAGNVDSGDGQGCWSGRRTDQAAQLRNFIANVQAAKADTDVLVIGDLNAYGKEDPVLNLTGNGYTDLLAAYAGTSDYSYVFDGEAGYLDHALATGSLANQVSGAAHWHINADEPFIIDYNEEFKQPACAACGPDYYSVSPYRSSDHDPVIVGLNLYKAITGTSRSETITGTAGDDRIVGGEGADVITGGAGRDVFVYNSLRDGVDTITDFAPGADRIDLSAIAASLRATSGTGVDLVGAGYIQLVDTASGLQVRIDTDGSAGTAAVGRVLLNLRGVTAAQFVASRDLML